MKALERIVGFLIEKVRARRFESSNRIPLRFLKRLTGNGPLEYLEVGAGLGKFLRTVKEQFSDMRIKAIEISQEMADKLKNEGFDCRQASIVKMPFPDESFDIVHCSHVIEHLTYPDVADALDEMLRVTRVGGHLIIRSPLMNPHFYTDIDHVRPYPPDAVMAHFEKEQIQRRGKAKVKMVQVWFEYLAFIPFKYTTNVLKKTIRKVCLGAWTLCGWPRSGPENYIVIIEKIS
jgi:ubiquinone/menaquinone biosynthesis C-methylase UbiE